MSFWEVEISPRIGNGDERIKGDKRIYDETCV